MSETGRARGLLVKELLRARDLAGLSGRELARRIGLSQAQVSRIDRAVALPSAPQARAWLAECSADADTTERVLALLETAMGETRPWGELLAGRRHLQDVVRRLDDAATRVRNFQPTVIPGLLQTEAYARAILSLERMDDVEAAVAARLAYQGQVLGQPNRRFECVIWERALHWEPAPGALVRQQEKIIATATLDTVDVAILPVDATPVVPWHNFVIRESASGETYITTELIHGTQHISDPDSVELYLDLWSRVRGAAVTGADALQLFGTE